MFNALINRDGHMPEYWLMVGLLRDQYRRTYCDYELDKRLVEAIDIDSSSLTELALKWVGVRSTDYEGLSDTFIAIAESMVESQLSADKVRKRIEEYISEVLGHGPGILPN